MERIWITWENQRRNRTLSNELDAKLYQIIFTKKSRLLRYLFSIFKTILIYLKEKPSIIFAQNPSIILALLAVIIGKISKTKIVIDAHNAGIFPSRGKKWWMNKLASFLIKNTQFTIVTNKNLAEHVKKHKGKPFVLPDPIPNFEISFHQGCRNLLGKHNIFFVCTFAWDEPYLEVIKAAKLLSKDICIYISGDYRNKVERSQIPDNVILTGYLSERDYLELLHSADLIIDLTFLKDCLVCGAYEAIAAEKPIILSDTDALKEYFYKGTLFTNNTYNDIAEQINSGISNIDLLSMQIAELKKELIYKRNLQRTQFEKLLKGA